MKLDKWGKGTIKLLLVLPIAFFCIFLMLSLSELYMIALVFVALVSYAIVVKIIIDRIFD